MAGHDNVIKTEELSVPSYLHYKGNNKISQYLIEKLNKWDFFISLRVVQNFGEIHCRLEKMSHCLKLEVSNE